MKGDLAEMAHMVNTASSEISKLKGGKYSRIEHKLKLLRSLHSDIEGARQRGVSYRALAKTISEATGVWFSDTTLAKCLKLLQQEEQTVAERMRRQLAEKHAKGAI